LAFGLLAGSIAVAACAVSPKPRDTVEGTVRVRVGATDSIQVPAQEESRGPVRDQLEDLFDLFWEAGCAGDRLRFSNRTQVGGEPDVVCTLPGESGDIIVLIAHIHLVSGSAGPVDNWASAASLPLLYRALATEERRHTFLFVGSGDDALRRRMGRYLQRLATSPSAEVRAIVELQDLSVGPEVWCASSDTAIREDLSAVALALGRSQSVRFYTPRSEVDPDASRIATKITIGTEGPGGEPDRSRLPGTANDGSALRLIAFFLGYIDQTLPASWERTSEGTDTPNRSPSE
jgi:hypothetical protein